MRQEALRVTELETRRPKIRIYFISDIHYGARNCMENEVKKAFKKIEQDSNSYVVLMGDLMEIASKHSPGNSLFEQIHSPNDQYEFIKEQIKPIKNRVIGAMSGNHEARMRKDFNFCLTRNLCNDLDIPYLTQHCNHLVTVGDKTWKLMSTHGKTGSTMKHTKINAVRKLQNIYEFDALFYGHTHLLNRDLILKYDVLERKYKWICCTGSFMSYLDGYGEQIEYEPLIPGYMYADIYSDRLIVNEHVIL